MSHQYLDAHVLAKSKRLSGHTINAFIQKIIMLIVKLTQV